MAATLDCRQVSNCPPCDENPIRNLTVADADPGLFMGNAFSRYPGDMGPLYLKLGCSGWCLSTISQEDADLCALKQADLCVDATYLNQPQTCVTFCPDGSLQRFTIPGGLFAGHSQAEADQKAYDWACKAAVASCLGAKVGWYNVIQSCDIQCPDGTIQTMSIPAGMIFSVISQDDANQQAYALACQLAEYFCLPRSGLVANQPQTCTLQCADGSEAKYTVPAGMVYAFTQAAADQAAYALACALVSCIPTAGGFWNTPQTCQVTCADGNVLSYSFPAKLIWSQISQADADQQAYTWACKFAQLRCPVISGLVPNTPQTCTLQCADGSQAKYTVPAGMSYAFTQAAADQAAYKLACALVSCTPTVGGFWNTSQTCQVTCADGSVLSYSFPAQVIWSSLNQADADQQAYAWACQFAQLRCPVISGLVPNTPQTCTLQCADGSQAKYTVPAERCYAFTQAAADQAAYALACALVSCIPTAGGFWNTPQTCQVTCADGSVLSYSFPAQIIWSSLSQTDADQQAYAWACRFAQLRCPVTSSLVCSTAQTATVACPDGSSQTATLPAGAVCAYAPAPQQQVDEQAYRLAESLAQISCPIIPPSGYWNTDQTCTVNCPDGASPQTVTIKAHSVFSLVSVADANQTAYNFACQLAQLTCVPGTMLVGNDEESVTVTCPDGSSVTYTVAAGMVLRFSKAQANADAIAFATSMAKLSCSVPLVGNTAQTCSRLCGGILISVTVPANSIFALDVASANALAHLYACWWLNLNCTGTNPNPVSPGTTIVNIPCLDGLIFSYSAPAGLWSATYLAYLAKKHQVCLSNLSSNVTCLDTPTDLTVSASGQLLYSAPGNDWHLVSGEVPPGLTFYADGADSRVAHFAGTPTQGGVFSCVVRFTSPYGDWMQKTFTLTVGSVTNVLPLPDAIVGTPYNLQLTATGWTTPLFQLFGGDLPTGLSMDSSGHVTGTPTVATTFTFEVNISEGA